MIDEECSVKCVGSSISWLRENWEQIDSIFLSVLGLVVLRLKSPVIIISLMPVSIARPIESSILERQARSEFGGL